MWLDKKSVQYNNPASPSPGSHWWSRTIYEQYTARLLDSSVPKHSLPASDILITPAVPGVQPWCVFPVFIGSPCYHMLTISVFCRRRTKKKKKTGIHFLILNTQSRPGASYRFVRLQEMPGKGSNLGPSRLAVRASYNFALQKHSFVHPPKGTMSRRPPFSQKYVWESDLGTDDPGFLSVHSPETHPNISAGV